MKKLFSKLRIISQVLSMAIIILVSVSCKSHKCCSDAQRAIQDSSALFSVARSVDTIYRHDSVYVREVQRGDTVYLTRTEWRDRWRTRVERDTVVDIRVEKEVVQLPPERYVPKFYKWCTALLWVIGILMLLRIVIRIRAKP